MLEAELPLKWLHTHGEIESVPDTLQGLSNCCQSHAALFFLRPFIKKSIVTVELGGCCTLAGEAARTTETLLTPSGSGSLGPEQKRNSP